MSVGTTAQTAGFGAPSTGKYVKDRKDIWVGLGVKGGPSATTEINEGAK